MGTYIPLNIVAKLSTLNVDRAGVLAIPLKRNSQIIKKNSHTSSSSSAEAYLEPSRTNTMELCESS